MQTCGSSHIIINDWLSHIISARQCGCQQRSTEGHWLCRQKHWLRTAGCLPGFIQLGPGLEAHHQPWIRLKMEQSSGPRINTDPCCEAIVQPKSVAAAIHLCDFSPTPTGHCFPPEKASYPKWVALVSPLSCFNCTRRHKKSYHLVSLIFSILLTQFKLLKLIPDFDKCYCSLTHFIIKRLSTYMMMTLKNQSLAVRSHVHWTHLYHVLVHRSPKVKWPHVSWTILYIL